MFLIVTVQISMECETQESEGGYHSLQRGQNPQICLQPPPTPPPPSHHYWLPTHFKNFVNHPAPPASNFTVSQPFYDCI